MLALLLANALADPPRDPATDVANIVSVDTTETVVYVFPLTRCDRFRAEQPVVTLPGPVPSKVVVTLKNQTMSTCLYRGVVLQGWLDGVYKPSQNVPDGAGLFIPPGGELSLRIKPYLPEAPRGALQLQLPPKGTAIVLVGTPPTGAPPDVVTPDP